MRKIPREPGACRAVRASYLVSGVSRERAFATLLEVRRFPEWTSGLRSVRLLDGALEVHPGVALAFSLAAAGLRHEVIGRVTVVESPSLLGWQYAAGAIGGGSWSVQQAGPGAVRITFSTDYEIEPAWLDRLAHRPFFRGVTERLLRRSLRRLGELLGGY